MLWAALSFKNRHRGISILLRRNDPTMWTGGMGWDGMERQEKREERGLLVGKAQQGRQALGCGR